MTIAAATAQPPALTASRWALLFGNFAIGCGVMVVAGALNDLTHSLHISAALGGQLIALAAAVMCFGAPLLAAAVAGWDRRRLLTLALAWYALGHLLSALMPGYAPLAAVRVITMLGAAVFTPQAAAAIPGRPLFSPETSAPSSTSSAREVLTNSAVGFICSR